MAKRKRKPYHGTLDVRGTTTRWRVVVDGRRRTATFDTTDLRIAGELAAERWQELKRQKAEPEAVSMATLFDRYETEYLPDPEERRASSQLRYRATLKVLRTYFAEECPDVPVAGVAEEHVRGYLTWRKPRRFDGQPGMVSACSRAKERRILGSVFRYAEELGYRPKRSNPVTDVKAPKARKHKPVTISRTQFQQFHAACEDQPMLALYVLLLGETGMRGESEALWLRWEHIDLEEGCIHITPTATHLLKTDDSDRTVAMSSMLREALKVHHALYGPEGVVRQAPWVFYHTETRRTHTAGDRLQSIRRSFQVAARRAGLPTAFRQHDLRHSATSWWMANGAHPAKVQLMLGHSSSAMTDQYTHLSWKETRDVVDRMVHGMVQPSHDTQETPEKRDD